MAEKSKSKTTGSRSMQRLVMARRERIDGARRDLLSALLTLRDHFKVEWTESCFKNLRFLVKHAKRAP